MSMQKVTVVIYGRKVVTLFTSELKRIGVNRFKYRYLMLEYITLEYFEY
jgi:hypothetical protein